jgi:diguanylate cyclase (GGDEF)-like protein
MPESTISERICGAVAYLVLVVDDDELVCDLLATSIGGDEFVVVTTTTGAEARTLMQERADELDVLILDINLPDTDGFELFSYSKNICPEAEVLIITGDASLDAVERAMQMGAFDFVEKPFGQLEANQTVRNAVERKRFRRVMSELSSTKRTLEAELTTKSFQIDQVREMVTFSRLINEHLRLESILDITYARLPELVNAETFSLFLYDPVKREFNLAITNRPNLEPREPLVIPEEKSPIMAAAIREHELFFVDDVSKRGMIPDDRTAPAGRTYKKKHSLCLPLKVEDRPIGVLNLNDFHTDENIQEYIDIAVLAAAYLAPVISNARLYTEIEEAANRDGLTQLHNRAYFDRSLSGSFRQAIRYGRPLSFLFMDIDHFKQFNDVHGHQAGDAVLRAVAERLSDNMRKGIDVVARYGGEEMVLLAPETPPDGIQIVAERIRSDIQAMTVKYESDTEEKLLSVTVSIGTATFTSEKNSFPNERALGEAADAAMYSAKHSGRNRCAHFNMQDLELQREQNSA